jgi:hypothetical protein
VHSLIFERILSKFAGNILRHTISGKDYVLFMLTHCTYECERACAKESVIKRSLIYGRILSKFAVNILQITSSSMGYVLFMFTHRMVKHSLIFGRILFKFAGHIFINGHMLHGLHTCHAHGKVISLVEAPTGYTLTFQSEDKVYSRSTIHASICYLTICRIPHFPNLSKLAYMCISNMRTIIIIQVTEAV